MKNKITSNTEFIICTAEQYEDVVSVYEHSVEKLQRTINYPKWSEEHPSRDYVEQAISEGEQFACARDGKIIGAVVLSENPEGKYECGNWSRELKRGEYLAVHILAVEPDFERSGVGSFLVDGSIDYAKKNGYRALRLDIVPDNIPAKRLYETKGFASAGIKDLERNIPEIPLFELYELNID